MTVNNIINGCIHSSLTNLTNNKSLNLSKMYNENLLCYENELKKKFLMVGFLQLKILVFRINYRYKKNH
jgi:hypothetical protein